MTDISPQSAFLCIIALAGLTITWGIVAHIAEKWPAVQAEYHDWLALTSCNDNPTSIMPLYAVIDPQTGVVAESGTLGPEGQLTPFDDSISSYDHEPLPFSKDDEWEYERRAADYKAGRPQGARGIGGYWPGRVLTLTEQQRN